jgi:hypothetical protein
MPSRRVAAVAAALALSSLLLAGCDKPGPSITVFSGSTSEHREALCWSPDAGLPPEASDCLFGEESPAQLADYVAVIPVLPGRTIGISVDPEVAEAGWSVTVNGRPLNSRLITDTYYRFALSEQNLRRGSLQLQVIGATSTGELTRGNWVFELAPETGEEGD